MVGVQLSFLADPRMQMVLASIFPLFYFTVFLVWVFRGALISITATVGAFLFLQGCTPKTAGMDSAYLNQNRGAAGAQISRAEARQYRRQQALAADEIRLENMKRRQTTDSIIEGSSAVMSGVSAVSSVSGLLRYGI